MSATALTPSTTPRPAGRADETVTPARILRSEWTKFRTLRSSWYTLLAAALALIVVGLIVGYATTASNWASLDPEDTVASAPLQGFRLGQLLIAALGVLFVTGEYATGMIRSTFAAVPNRLSVLGAKAAVFGAVAVVTMTVSSLLAFLGAEALFLSPDNHGISLFDSGVIGVVAGTGVYLALAGMLGLALGWIVRGTAGALSALIGILWILPLVVGLLPASISTSVLPYLPSNAGEAISTSIRGDLLAPWAGLAVLVGWVALAFVGAAVALRRRDA